MIGAGLVRNFVGQVNTIKAAVLATLADVGGALLVGFKQAGAGAVARTIYAKLLDLPISVKDFGAVGDGAADDTAAIVAAFAISKRVHFPSGTYRITDTIDLTAAYGGRITGEGCHVFSTGFSKLLMAVDNKPHLSVYGPVTVWDLAFEWVNQQTTAHTESTAIKLNTVSRFSLRNLNVLKANSSLKIAQAAGPTAYSTLYAGEIANVWSYNASECHFDLRGYLGGNTNLRLGPLYANGGYAMDLVPVPPTVTAAGQDCNYVLRLGNASGLELGALSCDGLFVKVCGVELNNVVGTIDTLRFEGVKFLQDNSFFIQGTGGYLDVSVRMLEFRSFWTTAADIPTGFHFIKANSPDTVLSVDLLHVVKTQLSNGGNKRLFVTGNINAGSSIRFKAFHIEADSATVDASAWSEGNSYYPPIVKEWGGQTTTRTLRAGRSNTTREEGYTAGAVPAAAVTGAPVDGDRATSLVPGDFGRVGRWILQGGAWVPSEFVGGDKPLSFVNTDADFALTPQASRPGVFHAGVLTANRTITLNAAGAWNGCTFRVTRIGGGAFTLSVGGLKALAQNQWCEVTYDGGAWRLMQFGGL